jgi:hypothetical protein
MTEYLHYRTAAQIRERLRGSDKLHLLDPSRDLADLGEADVLRRILQKDKFSTRLAAIRTGWTVAWARKSRFQFFGRMSIFFVSLLLLPARASFCLFLGFLLPI